MPDQGRRSERQQFRNTAFDPRRPDWLREEGVHWESWSINGEVVITGLVPPFPGGDRLAHCLAWLLRSYASDCRRTHDGTGAVVFAYAGPRTPTTLARTLSYWFDLGLQDARLIREHVRYRGGDPGACRWPRFWLEGATYYDFLTGMPIPPGRSVRRRLVVLAEERQVSVPVRSVKLADRLTREWAESLDALSSVDEAAVMPVLHEDDEAFLVSMLVLVHKQPAGTVRPRPSLEESYLRHERLMAELAPLGELSHLPVAWHALWRLPSGMTWRDPGKKPWMRYPAVSFAMGVRRLQRDPSIGARSEGASRRKRLENATE